MEAVMQQIEIFELFLTVQSVEIFIINETSDGSVIYIYMVYNAAKTS